MLRSGSRRVGFSPDAYERATISLKYTFETKKPKGKGPARSRSHNKPMQVPRGYTFTTKPPPSSSSSSSSSSSPVRLFRYVRTNVARALRLISRRRRPSAKASANVIPQRFVPPRDSHQSEALEDCIEFINSSYRKSF